MILLQASTWVDNNNKPAGTPAALLSGNRMVWLSDHASTTALKKVGVPYTLITARDFVHLMRKYPNADGSVAYPIPTPYNSY